MVAIKGQVKRIIYQNDTFLIGILENKKGESITFKGTVIDIKKDESLILTGKWVNHPKYGKQFNVVKWERDIPRTKEKIIAYLSSPFVKGCGKKRAEKIFNVLGENAIDIILAEKEQALINIKGIGKKDAEKIAASISETYELQTIINKLALFGINPDIAIKIYKKWQGEALVKIQDNPYILTEINGFQFPTIDKIAQKIGVSPFSSNRIESAILYVLECSTLYGHCYVPENELIKALLSLLNQNVAEQISQDEIQNILCNMEEQTICIENGNVYLKKIFNYETTLAKKIRKMLSIKPKRMSLKKINLYIKKYQIENEIILGDQQKKAIKVALQNRVAIISGAAGTGKTTVVKAIIDIYQRFYPNNNISLSAPTGRASRRLQEITGHFSQTNHKLLGYKQNSEGHHEFEYNEKNQLKYDFYIIDEMSMVDLHIAYSLFNAIKSNAKVLLIGDPHQLPSIGAGNVLKDLLDCKYIPQVNLTEIYRQAKNSQIITNANLVKEGKFFTVDHSKEDLYFIPRTDHENIKKTIVQSVKRFLELGYSLSDILVVSPIKKGIIGKNELNKTLQEIFNPASSKKSEIHFGNTIFREGDKVIQIVNNGEKGIYNGDTGIITRIGKQKIEDQEIDYIETDFQGVKTIHYRGEWNQLEHGFSISIHKSQGSQSPVVIMPLSNSHYKMLYRNLLYTGITRAEEKLVMIGQQSALEKAIQNNQAMKRNTQLTNRINDLFAISKEQIK